MSSADFPKLVPFFLNNFISEHKLDKIHLKVHFVPILKHNPKGIRKFLRSFWSQSSHLSILLSHITSRFEAQFYLREGTATKNQLLKFNNLGENRQSSPNYYIFFQKTKCSIQCINVCLKTFIRMEIFCDILICSLYQNMIARCLSILDRFHNIAIN